MQLTQGFSLPLPIWITPTPGRKPEVVILINRKATPCIPSSLNRIQTPVFLHRLCGNRTRLLPFFQTHPKPPHFCSFAKHLFSISQHPPAAACLFYPFWGLLVSILAFWCRLMGTRTPPAPVGMCVLPALKQTTREMEGLAPTPRFCL